MGDWVGKVTASYPIDYTLDGCKVRWEADYREDLDKVLLLVSVDGVLVETFGVTQEAAEQDDIEINLATAFVDFNRKLESGECPDPVVIHD